MSQPHNPGHRIPSWFWIPTILLLAFLLVTGGPLLMLDHAMRMHLANLLNQSRAVFLAGQGTTGLGFISQFVVSSLSGIFLAVLILYLRGKRAMLDEWKRNIVFV